MTIVTVFLGSSFDGGTEWDDLDFPAVPRVGEHIRQNGRSDAITKVEYYVAPDNKVSVRVLIPSHAKPHSTSALIS